MVRITADEQGWRLSQLPDAQAALVSLDASDGAIRALVGGLDFDYSKFNRVAQARRQPGSNIKPFIYAAAMENGFTPASVINDAPIVFHDPGLEKVWRPENDSGKFYGPTSLRTALVNSRNLVSIRLLQQLGVARAVDYLSNLGFERADLVPNLSLALGTPSLTPLSLVSAYAILANGGYRVQPYLVGEVRRAGGELVARTANCAWGECLARFRPAAGDADICGGWSGPLVARPGRRRWETPPPDRLWLAGGGGREVARQ